MARHLTFAKIVAGSVQGCAHIIPSSRGRNSVGVARRMINFAAARLAAKGAALVS
jgi:hypothetical protein